LVLGAFLSQEELFNAVLVVWIIGNLVESWNVSLNWMQGAPGLVQLHPVIFDSVDPRSLETLDDIPWDCGEPVWICFVVDPSIL
jgi:hypothetical protein